MKSCKWKVDKVPSVTLFYRTPPSHARPRVSIGHRKKVEVVVVVSAQVGSATEDNVMHTLVLLHLSQLVLVSLSPTVQCYLPHLMCLSTLSMSVSSFTSVRRDVPAHEQHPRLLLRLARKDHDSRHRRRRGNVAYRRKCARVDLRQRRKKKHICAERGFCYSLFFY